MKSLTNIIRLINLVILCFLLNAVKAQEENPLKDPVAEKILDNSSETVTKLKSLQADFVINIDDRKENLSRSEKGKFLLSGNKYKLTTGKDEIFYDGTTMWTYNSEFNEVIITEPIDNNNDIFSNPMLLLSIYKNDFKYRYIDEITVGVERFHEIDLYPEDLSEPYVRIKLLINTLSFIPEIIHMQGKDGVDYTITFTNISSDKDVTDSAFRFNAQSYSRVEVIDMRGVK